MADESSKKESQKRPSDPKLRSFLKQAAAIIATARGLNEESQTRLRALADKLELSGEQLQTALSQLKQSDRAVFRLNHWERDFVQQLQSRLKGLPQNILKPKTELKIIEAATDKYQIDATRAQQLIDYYVEQLDVARIKREDAIELVRSSVETIVGSQVAINEQEQNKLVDFGKTWGVSHDEVVELVESQLQRNRTGASRRRFQKAAVACSGILFVLVLIASAYFWYAGWFRVVDQSVDQGVPSASVAVQTQQVKGVAWWDEETRKLLVSMLNEQEISESQFEQLKSNLAEDRMIALKELGVRWLTGNPADSFQNAFARLSHNDPSPASVGSVLSGLLVEFLRPQEKELPSSPQQLKRSLAANQNLAMAFRDASETDAQDFENHLSGLLSVALSQFWNSELEPMERSEYLAFSNKRLLRVYWAQLLNTAWASTSRASLLIDDLAEYSTAWLSKDEANKKLHQSLFSILDSSLERFRDMPGPIERAIDGATETQLQRWVDYYLANAAEVPRNWLGDRLARRLKLEKRLNLDEQLAKYRKSFQLKKYAKLIQASEALRQLTRSVLNEINLSGSLNRPDQIAELAYVNNILLQFENAETLNDKQLNFFISDSTRPLPILRNEIGLKEMGIGEITIGAAPTEFEIRQLNELVGQLAQNSSNSVKRRAFDSIAELSRRFPRITYPQAQIIARHILQSNDLETALNIEKNLTSFAEWPNLGLALADELEVSERPLDDVLTLLSLQSGTSLGVNGKQNWKKELQSQIRDIAIKKLRQQLESRPTPLDLDWKRLQLYMKQVILQRASYMGDGITDVRNLDFSSVMSRMEQQYLKRIPQLPNAPQFRAAKVVFENSNSELEAVVVNLQRMVRLLAATTVTSSSQVLSEISQSEKEYLQLAKGKTAGQRLLLVERWLLKVLLIRHKTKVSTKVGVNVE